MFSPAFEPVAIPFEGTTLPGYFYQVDDSGAPRPTLIATGGYDSTVEELYFWNAAAALRRGYNCLCFDGPGQGAPLIKQQLYMRPDWENVVRPVVDYALTRREVDPTRIVLTGLSWGGYLAPRAASGEHRLAACIADTGQYDLLAAIKRLFPLPQETLDRLPNVDPEVLQPLFDCCDERPDTILELAPWDVGARASHSVRLRAGQRRVQSHRSRRADHLPNPGYAVPRMTPSPPSPGSSTTR